jgi:hypothetical protein
MYRSGSALWFGWTKNLYLGANRSWGMMVYMAAIMLFLYHLPWLALGILLANGDGAEIMAISNYKLQITNYQLPITLLTIAVLNKMRYTPLATDALCPRRPMPTEAAFSTSCY